MLPLVIPIAALAAQLGGQLYGSAKSAQAMSNLRKYLDQRKSQSDDYYGSLIGQNYLDTAEAKSAVNAMRDGMKRNVQALNNSGVAAGMTDEGRVAAAGDLNDRLAQGISQIAANGTAYKDSLRRQWRGESNALDDTKMGLQAQQVQNMGQMGNNIANAFGSMGYAYGSGAFKNLGNNTAAGQINFNPNSTYDVGGAGASGAAAQIKPLYT